MQDITSNVETTGAVFVADDPIIDEPTQVISSDVAAEVAADSASDTAKDAVESVETQDPATTPLSELPAEMLSGITQSLTNYIKQIYNQGDGVNVILVNPADEELFKQKFAELEIPEEIKNVIQIVADERIVGIPNILLQSKVELSWLIEYFNSIGLFTWLESRKCPVIPNHNDLKTLLLNQAFQDCLALKKRIVTP